MLKIKKMLRNKTSFQKSDLSNKKEITELFIENLKVTANWN